MVTLNLRKYEIVVKKNGIFEQYLGFRRFKGVKKGVFKG